MFSLNFQAILTGDFKDKGGCMNRRTYLTIVIALLILITFIIVRQTFVGNRSKESPKKYAPTSNNARKNSVDLEVKPEVGHRAPDFTLETLNGETIKLSELKDTPVLINFWATWCGACREEMPILQKAQEKYLNRVKILAINLANSERSLKEVKEYLKDNQLTFTVPLDKDGSVADSYRVRAIPTSFFIDKNGVIKAKFIGTMSEEVLEENVAKILD
jgi:thiol-disulfide isomerase/thioredoxin